MRDDLVERVARGVAETYGGDFAKLPKGQQNHARNIARSIIPIVLEEAAKVADSHFPEGFDNAYRAAGKTIADAIRAKMENLT